MSAFRASRIVLFVLLTTLSIVDLAQETYQKATIRKGDPPTGQSCDLIDGSKGYQISNCGDFRGGQQVEYRVKDKKVYIRREGGQESKCPITAELSGRLDPAAPTIQAPKYQKGTIEGFEKRKDITTNGGAGVLAGAVAGGPTILTKKVYRLRGPDLIYEFDYCGSFQAGQFTPGQEVEYRVSANRLFIRHDNDKEYSCQIEGTEKLIGVNSAGESGSSSTRVAEISAASVAKLSITSTPDSADIEIDGNFAGNTPSDLAVAKANTRSP